MVFRKRSPDATRGAALFVGIAALLVNHEFGPKAGRLDGFVQRTFRTAPSLGRCRLFLP